MACSVKANRHGTLALRLYWNGREWWEGLGLPDTKANRDKVQRIADAISAEIRVKAFTPERYLHYFPHGNRAAEFSALRPEASSSAPACAPTLSGYADLWLPRQQPPFVRPAQRRDYNRDIRRYVLPARIKREVGECRIGDLPLSQLAPKHLLDLRERLRARGLATKTVRNIIDGSFRAMVRDARTVDLLIATDPFSA